MAVAIVYGIEGERFEAGEGLTPAAERDHGSGSAMAMAAPAR